jgi:hypothetical protein
MFVERDEEEVCVLDRESAVISGLCYERDFVPQHESPCGSVVASNERSGKGIIR